MAKLSLGFIIIFALACGKEKANDEIPQEPATPDYIAEHDAAMRRAEAGFLDRGFVVSRDQNGNAKHQGDSLFFSGLLVASAKCEQALLTEQALQRAILVKDGQLTRHPDIDAASVDGAIGLFLGVAARYKKGCASFQSWGPALRALKAYSTANDGRLNDNSDAGLDAFDFVLDLLLDRIAGGNSPDYLSDRRDFLSTAMGGWAWAIDQAYKLAKATGKDPPAAYRVHLALLTLETLEALGSPVKDSARNTFCHASQGMDMPTVDHYCGRRSIVDWLPSFRYNEWEFRHQRAALWETPDGNGYETPAVDYLIAIDQGFLL